MIINLIDHPYINDCNFNDYNFYCSDLLLNSIMRQELELLPNLIIKYLKELNLKYENDDFGDFDHEDIFFDLLENI